jgi:transcriptional regulator with XRE-family HTH domain
VSELKRILISTYQRRKSSNPGYSRNAFARDLQVSPTALSQFLSDKRSFSRRNVQRIVAALDLPAEDVDHFLNFTGKKKPAIKADVNREPAEIQSPSSWDISSLTVSLDPRSAEQVKNEIKKFKNRVTQISRSSKGLEIYSLSIQFLPAAEGTRR